MACNGKCRSGGGPTAARGLLGPGDVDVVRVGGAPGPVVVAPLRAERTAGATTVIRTGDSGRRDAAVPWVADRASSWTPVVLTATKWPPEWWASQAMVVSVPGAPAVANALACGDSCGEAEGHQDYTYEVKITREDAEPPEGAPPPDDSVEGGEAESGKGGGGDAVAPGVGGDDRSKEPGGKKDDEKKDGDRRKSEKEEDEKKDRERKGRRKRESEKEGEDGGYLTVFAPADPAQEEKSRKEAQKKAYEKALEKLKLGKCPDECPCSGPYVSYTFMVVGSKFPPPSLVVEVTAHVKYLCPIEL